MTFIVIERHNSRREFLFVRFLYPTLYLLAISSSNCWSDNLSALVQEMASWWDSRLQLYRENNERPARRILVALPWWEQTLYWIIEMFTIGYMIYSLFVASEQAWRTNEPITLYEGWAVIGRPRDANDYEWAFWSSYVWKVLPFVASHVAIAALCTAWPVSVKTKQVVLTLYGALVVARLLGFYTTVVLCIHPVVCYLVSFWGSSMLVWIVTVSFIALLNFHPHAVIHFLFELKQSSPLNDHHEYYAWHYMCVIVWANMCQRAVAFALECVWVHQRRGQRDGAKTPSTALGELPGWLDLFFYMFYLPLFFTGPLMTYNNFHNQTRLPATCTARRLLDIVLSMARIVMWAFINCLILHYVYPHALNHSRITLEKQSRWTLAAIGWALGQFFMMKYLVIFGFPAQVARIDGFEPPAVPACISYVYCYGDMWKCFDRGLYGFLKRYIFIPCGGSRVGLPRQIWGSVLCFLYIFHWHGGDWYLFLWSLVNFIETGLERLGAWSEFSPYLRRVFYNYLYDTEKRRLRAAVSVPLFYMSVLAIFYFFGGVEMTGDVFLDKLILDIPLFYFAIIMLLMYCAIQNAMEVERLGLTKYKVSANMVQ